MGNSVVTLAQVERSRDGVVVTSVKAPLRFGHHPNADDQLIVGLQLRPTGSVGVFVGSRLMDPVSWNELVEEVGLALLNVSPGC